VLEIVHLGAAGDLVEPRVALGIVERHRRAVREAADRATGIDAHEEVRGGVAVERDAVAGREVEVPDAHAIVLEQQLRADLAVGIGRRQLVGVVGGVERTGFHRRASITPVWSRATTARSVRAPTREGQMSDPFSYSGKRVVVTGGATGVGAALLDLLVELDAANVTVLDVKEPSGPHHTFLQTDLADPDAVDKAIAAIDGSVDVLFNNAGVADTMPPRTVIAVNYLALRRLSEGLLDRIGEGGAIVNTASTAGGQWASHLAQINEVLDLDDWAKTLEWTDTNLADMGVMPYFFSKELVQVWTMRSSRPTVRRGVRTNSVCPAPID